MEPTEETDIIDAIDEYLTTKHTTVYGQFYDIQNPKRRRQAAEWLYGEMSALLEFIDAK
jgi:hypothetical protein